MKPYLLYVVALLVLSMAAIHIFAEYYGPRWLVYWAKPITVLLILTIAVLTPQPISRFYQAAIVIGLLFSLAGDIFLMLPADRFLAGLVSFLFAHLCYISAFAAVMMTRDLSWWGAPVIFTAGGIYLVLRPNLGAMQLPVLLYMAVISLMAWLAITMFVQWGEGWALSAAVGAILFVLSDATLALNHFRRRFWYAQLLVLGSYYLAQWLIALSI